MSQNRPQLKLTTVPSFSSNIDDNELQRLRASVLLQYQKSLHNQEYHTSDIVSILGGIDQILNVYLTFNSIPLNIDQLNKLQNILNISGKLQSYPNQKSLEDDTSLITYTYHINDTYFHCCFNDKTASNIISYIQHPISIGINTVLSMVYIVIEFLNDGKISSVRIVDNFELKYPQIFYIYKFIACIITTIYLILWLLAVNRTVFTKSIKHFVFWLKIIVSIQTGILYVVLRYVFIKDREPTFVNTMGCTFFAITVTLIVVCISAIDGYYAPRKLKIGIGIALSLLFTWYAIFVTFLVDYDEKAIVDVGFIKINVTSLMGAALRILAIFMWKSTTLLILKKDKCVNIRVSPNIKWQ